MNLTAGGQGERTTLCPAPFNSLQPQGHPSPSWGSMSPRAGPGNGLAHPSPHPAVMESVLSCAGSAPSRTACRGSGVTVGQAVQDLGVSTPPECRAGGAEPQRAPARWETCSGQTGGGAQAGEAEIRASIRELWRRRAAGNGGKGLLEGHMGGSYTYPTPLNTTARCSESPGQYPLPQG